ncbi:hypothetical protein E2C01_015080 [Portunus trituberculatus]|uniref:Uncharacterized protein n=1 Tax=Portunus trituberculatus TaxID=210409 RepID=A0A5B7DM07_PORTR|nr:hypothetical protein [Portunus trituberculatus]
MKVPRGYPVSPPAKISSSKSPAPFMTEAEGEERTCRGYTTLHPMQPYHPLPPSLHDGGSSCLVSAARLLSLLTSS